MAALGIIAVIVLLVVLITVLDELTAAPPSAHERRLEVELDALRTAQRLDLAAHVARQQLDQLSDGP